ncbi:MAG: hypothetical protein N2204_02770, partial [Anaerolineae bacterium]|nr:hypothetical protein [Anaerolineae bacterium]
VTSGGASTATGLWFKVNSISITPPAFGLRRSAPLFNRHTKASRQSGNVFPQSKNPTLASCALRRFSIVTPKHHAKAGTCSRNPRTPP